MLHVRGACQVLCKGVVLAAADRTNHGLAVDRLEVFPFLLGFRCEWGSGCVRACGVCVGLWHVGYRACVVVRVVVRYGCDLYGVGHGLRGRILRWCVTQCVTFNFQTVVGRPWNAEVNLLPGYVYGRVAKSNIYRVGFRTRRLSDLPAFSAASAVAAATSGSLGWWLGSKLRPVVDGGRRQETVGDGGRRRKTAGDGGSLLLRVSRSLLLRVSRASTHGQETLGATGSNRKQQSEVAVYFPTTNLGCCRSCLSIRNGGCGGGGSGRCRSDGCNRSGCNRSGRGWSSRGWSGCGHGRRRGRERGLEVCPAHPSVLGLVRRDEGGLHLEV